jgi:putative nucleotidyltransferase with HDIG domain
MRIDRRLFRSKLAHRVFLAFALCALVPIAVVGVVSYRSVTEQLVAQASTRLRQTSKALGLSIYERLLFAETELENVSRRLLLDPDLDPASVAGSRLASVEVVNAGTGFSVDATSPRPEFQLRRREIQLAEGKSVLMPIRRDEGAVSVALARRLDPTRPISPLVVGRVEPRYLWGLDEGNAVPDGNEFCVFDSSGELIHGTFAGCREALESVEDRIARGADGVEPVVFPVASRSGERFVAGHRALFLDARFLAPDWMVVVCEPRSVTIRPIARWRFVFPAVVLLALWVVLIGVIGAIRKNLDPIERLREGTDHLARRDFDYEVEIRTGDEFEQLAASFNDMSKQLKRQFGALAATGRIHRAILSTIETGQIVETALDGVVDYFECDRAAVIVVGEDGRAVDRSSIRPGDGGVAEERSLALSQELGQQLGRVPQGVVVGHDLPAPGELEGLLGMVDLGSVFAVPIVIRGILAAVIGLGFESARTLPEDELDRLTQLADQFAVAFSNARMVEEVNDFSLGTLEALARAVDAKSPWTAGHSERVTRLAVTIGAEYGLDPFELSKLHRGAMLHDIGKLGISQTLLDKRGRLDSNEYNVVRSHTTIGERILEPIASFAELMPVVTQHHEWYDGNGYPNGLARNKIDIKARILAVADVYDAMTNPRPYRESVEPHRVVSMICEQAGRQFDPEVVSAFLRVIESRGGIEHLVMLKKDFSFFKRNAAGSQWTAKDRPVEKSS